VKAIACLFMRSPVRHWVWLFIAINTLINISGSDNPVARWTMMAAMAEDHSFRIDHYYRHTIDWSRTPDGHYYSNKAPGPSLIGYPLFWVLDNMDTGAIPERESRDLRRSHTWPDNLRVLSILTQVIPFAIVALLLMRELEKLGCPRAAVHLSAVALLFGNTASLFMNSYFGHGMAAVFILATILSLMRRWPARIGLFFGLAVLCDYADCLLGLPLLIALWQCGLLRPKKLFALLSGAAAPAIAFMAYHQIAFGGPLQVSTKYVNPAFVDVPSQVPALWGVLRLIPNFHTLSHLLLEPDRGLLYTQAWVLVTSAALFLALWYREPDVQRKNTLPWLAVFASLGLAIMVWMNGCWGGWHGGATAGPRYLASILPATALLIPLIYRRVPPFVRQLLVVSTIPAVVFFILVFATKNVLSQPDIPLLQSYLGRLLADQSGEAPFRMLLMVIGFGWAGWCAFHTVETAVEGAD
jgi:hypothetical protein